MSELRERSSMFNINGEQDTVGLPRVLVVMEDSDTSGSSPLPTSSSSDNWKMHVKSAEIPPEYWHIQKLVKYMNAGNQTATIVALSCLKDHDLTIEVNQRAIVEIGGLETLVNLLETRDLCCILGSLAVLKDLSDNKEVRSKVLNFGVVNALVGLLSDPAADVRALAGETIAQLAKNPKGRKLCRKRGGIPKLIELLDISERILKNPTQDLTDGDKISLNICKAGCKALWSMATSKRCREAMRKEGLIPLLNRTLDTGHLHVAIPAMGLLQMCVEDPSYRTGVMTERVMDIITQLAKEDKNLKTYCSLAINKCARDPQIRKMIREAGGLDLLLDVASDATDRKNKSLIGSVTGALWKCSDSEESIKRLDELGAVPIFISLLEDENLCAVANACGALFNFAKYAPYRDKIKANGGIPHLVNLLNQTYKPVLENTSMVLMECAKSLNCIEQIEELDGIRLIWSLLKNESNAVKVSAAWALCPCIQNAKDSGEMVRSFVGALELTVDLLDSNDNKVLAAVCAMIAIIAQDNENLAVISDLSVVEKLSSLVPIKDEHLRANLALAIAYCSKWEDNSKEFGRRRAVTPLVRYLHSTATDVRRSTALALYHLSFNPVNCVTMHAAGCVSLLLTLIGSEDATVQEASGGCLANIRKLALATEKINLKQ